jgi:hypothetical protein
MQNKYMVVLKEGELEILENILEARRELCKGDSDDYPALYSAATELRVQLFGGKPRFIKMFG